MVSDAELMFQLGSIMLLAFIAATLAGRLNQSVMVGYIVIGVLIGPKISVELFGVQYNGLITDTGFIDMLSSIGLIMLMFFVGLEFSFSKLKKTRKPAVILAIIDISVGLFVGFLFASYLGWPLIDSLFLAGVIAMSSTSIAMKVLFDLKRISSPEVEFLIGLVVVETFIAMVILAIASGMVVEPSSNPAGYGQLILGIVAFYGFFVWMAMWAVPRVVRFFDRIENDELFILFALGVVFLTSGIAAVMNVPPIIGAFFIGMILSESKVSVRVQSKLESFKDAFVAVFFTSFGMMIDPAMFGKVAWMLLLAVPIVLVYEAFVMSGVSYLLGFSGRASSTIGTSMTGRGIESILYASVGSRVSGVTMSAQLNPFAGAFCFIMSAITPPFVKHSAAFANALAKIVPKPLRFSGTVVSRTLGKAILPSSQRLAKGSKMTGIVLASFVAVCIPVLLTGGLVHILFTALGVLIAVFSYFVIRSEIGEIARHVNYSNIGVATNDKDAIVYLVSSVISGAVFSVLAIVSSWTYLWQLSLFVIMAYFVYLVAVMTWTYKRLYVAEFDQPQKVYRVPSMLGDLPEPEPDLPKPVYGAVRTAPKDALL